MNDRQKARAFLQKEGHGKAVRDMNVHEGDKKAIRHPHRIGVAAPAEAHKVYSGGEMHADGLTRKGVGSV